ncbi:hypothetical protein PV325_010766 [Microctonus aethiopoides]|uniref:CCDC113/CCDC96 coiled-coil domain-containing protein n=1 Tax=Microctonus aethiopoides TaxID=144406 RepID=A0AA39F725_9HYME|nr:hypothetical protein PV325_010766 [Microctonus aethiopoides]KAK0092885.1 hypothetical protein PV326_000383 [Microctonus aethiopoides]KAK0164147.1 hypothetical protein PV328_002808 [Microctonus aethiopoides]
MNDDDENEAGRIFDDDSLYQYSQIEKKKYENEETLEDDAGLEDYFFDDYKLGFLNVVKKVESNEKLNLNLEKVPTVPDLSVVEKRLHTISQLQELHEQKRQLKLKNRFLHKKCCDVFIKLKMISYLERWGFDSDIHQDKRYTDMLKEFKKIKIRKEEAEIFYDEELKKNENAYQIAFSEFHEAFEKLTSRELEIGVASISRRTKKIETQPIIDLLNKQKQRFNILSQSRVKYFKLENLLANINDKLVDKNMLGEEYTMIKYDNLMTNKNMALEKIDKREKNLNKIRDKFYSVVNMLAHVREGSVGVSYKIKEAVAILTDLEDLRRKKRVELLNKIRQRELLNKQVKKKNLL